MIRRFSSRDYRSLLGLPLRRIEVSLGVLVEARLLHLRFRSLLQFLHGAGDRAEFVSLTLEENGGFFGLVAYSVFVWAADNGASVGTPGRAAGSHRRRDARSRRSEPAR